MSLSESIESLRNFDLNDLDFNNVGSWPSAVKGVIFVLFFVALLGAGYYFHLSDLQVELERAQSEEGSLKQHFSGC
jgi:type IV pilus assembly protein PilO